MSRMLAIKRTSTKKGFFAICGYIGTGILFWKTPWFLGAGGLVGSLYLTWDWFKWRASHGLRFK